MDNFAHSRLGRAKRLGEDRQASYGLEAGAADRCARQSDVVKVTEGEYPTKSTINSCGTVLGDPAGER